MKLTDVPVVDTRPRGYRPLGYFSGVETDVGALFDYRGKRVWIPKRTLRFADGRYHAPGWAIDSSKAFQQKGR